MSLIRVVQTDNFSKRMEAIMAAINACEAEGHPHEEIILGYQLGRNSMKVKCPEDNGCGAIYNRTSTKKDGQN